MNLSVSSSKFSQVMLSGQSASFRDLSFKYLINCGSGISFSVSKKYGGAVDRNLFKRRCRSIYQKLFISSKINVSIIVFPKSKNISFKSVLFSFSSLHEKIIH